MLDRRKEGRLTSRQVAATLLTLGALLLLTTLISALVGAETVRFERVFAPRGPDNPDPDIFLGYRLPRVLMAVLVGAALGTAGVALQAILRNPLADPHILGISGGAGLGGILAMIMVPASSSAAYSLVPLSSFAGAIGAMLLVYGLASRGGRLNPFVLLMAGVIVNSFCSALILLINSLADLYQSHSILFWLIGGIASQGYMPLLGMAIYVGIGLAVLFTLGGSLNLLALGEESAQHLGVDVRRVRTRTFFATSLLVGGVMAFCGMIGFVGLMIPHILRLILGPDHRLLLPASTLGGAIFLVAADTLARTVLPHSELPVGVLTTLCGGPFFIALMLHKGRKEWMQ
jgi:iron complex transport system permease protein